MKLDPADRSDPVIDRLMGIHHAGATSQALKELRELISQVPETDQVKRARYTHLEAVWSRVIDPYWSAARISSVEIDALRERTLQAFLRRRFDEALKASREYLAACEFGSTEFSAALSSLADAAALSGRLNVAKPLLDMFVIHWRVVLLAGVLGATPSEEISHATAIDSGLMELSLMLPLHAAVAILEAEPSEHWADLLEWIARITPFRHGRYVDAARVLVDYYARVGRHERAEVWRSVVGT